jgi:putative transposase
MIERGGPLLPVTLQCTRVGMSRSAWDGPGRTGTPLHLALMTALDARAVETPGHGSRQIARYLCNEGSCVGRSPVRRVMAPCGLARRLSDTGANGGCPRSTASILLCPGTW